MTRQFRPYGKKRGERRTGSRKLGSFGEALFYLFFFGVGISGLTLMLARFLVPEWRADRDVVEWLLLLLPVSFIVIGGAGVVRSVLHSSTSTERRAALTQKAAQLDLFDDGDPRGLDHPHVPPTGNITDSPGTRLAYRLPVESIQSWKLMVRFFLCLFWNVGVGWAAVHLFRESMGWRGYILALAVLLPLAAAGLWLLYQFVRKLREAPGIGATLIEISNHPLYPGRSYQAFLSQSGRGHIHTLEAFLVCEEAATFRQGTNTRTATQRVFQQPVLRREGIEVRPGKLFEALCELHVPAGAMHSFKSEYNEVKWRLIVRTHAEGYPESEQTFPVIVFPDASQRGQE